MEAALCEKPASQVPPTTKMIAKTIQNTIIVFEEKGSSMHYPFYLIFRSPVAVFS